MTALLVIAAGLALAAAGWWWSAQGIEGSTRVAIVAVLGVTAAAFNVVVPVPSIEATTTIVLCTALVLGGRTGAAAGLVAVVASSVTGGIGIWTAWQVVAVLVVACIGTALGARARSADWFRARRVVLLGMAAAVAALAWDIVTTAGSALSLAPAPGLEPAEQLVSFLLLGAAFTATHVVFTTAFTVVCGPPLLHALGRARPRLDGGTVVG